MGLDTQTFLDELLEGARIPGIACAVTWSNGRSLSWYAGHHSWDVDAAHVSRETVFDLASLTKVLTTHQWVLRLVSKGVLDLEAPISEYVIGLKPWLAACPVWRLANHSSGLIGHLEFFKTSGPRVLKTGNFDAEYQTVLDQIIRQSPSYPPGTSQVYSDLGYILLACICEQIDQPMPEAMPLLFGHGPHAIHWRKSRQVSQLADLSRYAATEQCAWRGRLIQGEVHDDNCWSMGGLAGHAGSFGTLEAVHLLSTEWLAALCHAPNRLDISPATIQQSQSTLYAMPDTTRVLGWDRSALRESSTGTGYTPLSPGHLGYTGTSVWLDVEHGVAITLLTNRVCPSRSNDSIKWVRPLIHNHLRGLENT